MLDRTSAFNRKDFVYDFIDFAELKRIDGETRLYETPNGQRYPSVTTVLGKMQDKTALEAWKKRVGEAEATRVSNRASTRGTNIHTMCENYVLGANLDLSMPFNNDIFYQLKSELDAHVDNIKATECTLWSDRLKVAGTCDLIAEYDGKLSIIDYKTSAKPKRKDWIEGYFMQCSIYAYCLWEMTGIMAKQIVVMIGVDQLNTPQVFVEKPSTYLEKAADLVDSYHRMYTC